MSQEDILADFPDLQAEHMHAVLHYAAKREARRRTRNAVSRQHAFA
jgi:uncharacterized protein (DUF433 family)